MKKLTSFIFATLLAASAANAHLIEYGQIGQGGSSNPSSEATEIIGASIAGIGTDPLVYLAKWSPSNTWDGDGLYGDDKFDVTNYLTTTPSTADVSWDLTGTGYTLEAVLVKTANTHMRIYSVSADQKIIGGPDTVTSPHQEKDVKVKGVVVGTTFEDKSSISHITFFGRKGNTTVPDTGSTLVLLGLGLGVLGFLKRRK